MRGTVGAMTGDAGRQFEAYDSSHLTVLAIFAVGAVGVIWLGRRVRGEPREVVVRRVFAVAVAAVTIPLQILQFLPDEWDPDTSLPFQLCDLAWMFAVHALWTRHRLSATVTWLWGISLTTQGMITPDIGSVFPELRFVMFWAMHVLIVWSALLLVPGLQILPTWHTYRVTVAITLVWAVVVFGYNTVAGSNYGYLNERPESASILDLLGPWPLYVVLEVAIVALVWAALTWPWTRGDREVDDVRQSVRPEQP